VFKDVTLTYAGGAARIGHLSLSGTTRVSFTGAAANAIFMMNFLQSVMAGKPLAPPKQNDPILKTATAPTTINVSFATPYGQK
jgi:hypothetical protein